MKCYHKVYMHNNKKTQVLYWGPITKKESYKEFVKLRDSDIWDCIVVDDITEEEFKKRK